MLDAVGVGGLPGEPELTLEDASPYSDKKQWKSEKLPISSDIRQLANILTEEQQKICDFLTTWTAQQDAFMKEHVAKNKELASAFLEIHKNTMNALQQREGTGKHPGTQLGNVDSASEPAQQVVPNSEHMVQMDPNKLTNDEQVVKQESLAAEVAKGLEALEKDDVLLDAWRKSSGLQTVDKWVKNYRKHPGAWGALLTIHGIPEVTCRLRTKVENYAIYSALFLSMSIALVVGPPSSMTGPNPYDDWTVYWWIIELRKRIFFYGLAIGTGSHMLSILLGMAFVNALNETARDSDVYRMFSRGKGFIATVKCQYAFRVGCVGDYVAMAVAATAYIQWYEVLIVGLLMLLATARTFRGVAHLLFSTGSIVKYWRTELGGKPDNDDPYDLDIPIKCFEQRSECNKKLFDTQKGLFFQDLDPRTPGIQNELFDEVRKEEGVPTQVVPHRHGEGMSTQKKAGVAAIF